MTSISLPKSKEKNRLATFGDISNPTAADRLIAYTIFHMSFYRVQFWSAHSKDQENAQ